MFLKILEHLNEVLQEVSRNFFLNFEENLLKLRQNLKKIFMKFWKKLTKISRKFWKNFMIILRKSEDNPKKFRQSFW